MGWILGSTNSPVSSSKWLRNENAKMRLFEVNIPLTNLLTGLFSMVYFQVSGAFLLPLVPETFHAQFPVSVKSL